MNIIDDFRTDEYNFLMNSHPSEVELDGDFYPTVEHAFQAAKTDDSYDRNLIRAAPTARQAKRIGRKIMIRPGWDSLRVAVMNELLVEKFSDPVLSKQLMQTGKAELISGGDDFWGDISGQGQNHLGKLLMDIRETKMEEAVGELKEASRNFLTNLGWEREPAGDNLFDECWVRTSSPNCYFDLESAIIHQLKSVISS